MAMLFDEVMTLRSITFTQDRNRGTLSVLDLVNPRLLNGQKTFDVGDYTDPKDGKILDTAPAIWQHGIKSVTREDVSPLRINRNDALARDGRS